MCNIHGCVYVLETRPSLSYSRTISSDQNSILPDWYIWSETNVQFFFFCHIVQDRIFTTSVWKWMLYFYLKVSLLLIWWLFTLHSSSSIKQISLTISFLLGSRIPSDVFSWFAVGVTNFFPYNRNFRHVCVVRIVVCTIGFVVSLSDFHFRYDMLKTTLF